jgi:hypothetical protein
MATSFPHPTRRRALTRLAQLLSLPVLAGCVNPNAIGVQDTGTISGRVSDAVTQAGIENAIVSVGTVTGRTQAGGAFAIVVPIGQQTVIVSATGYQSLTGPTVNVVKNETSVISTPLALQPLT